MERHSVSSITRAVGNLLAGQFPDVLVEGEVSGFKAYPSGHWYFSVKDDRSVLSCTMFREKNQKVLTPPKDGDQVILRGSVEVYAPKGSYALIVRGLRVEGGGDLARRFEELRRKLAAEGLFDRRKQPIPDWPKAIGVATSPMGAALQDILKVISSRFPAIPVYLAPCKVQGEGSAAEIAAAIRLLNQHGKASVIIAGRGGGAIEDLWAFNEEVVVRAVAASRIPIISAVGHETDVTLSDFAADLRAATPSQAAEIVTPARQEVLARVDQDLDHMRSLLYGRLRLLRERLTLTRRRLVHPLDRVRQGRRRCDELEERLRLALDRLFSQRRAHLERIRLPDLGQRLAFRKAQTAALERRLQLAVRGLLQARRERFITAARSLDALSPLSVLSRGYALVEKEGHTVQSIEEVQVNDQLRVKFTDGTAEVRVEHRILLPNG